MKRFFLAIRNFLFESPAEAAWRAERRRVRDLTNNSCSRSSF